MGIAVRSGLAGAALCLLAACGGGGGGGGGIVNPPAGNNNNYTPGVFPSRADLAGQCITPRPGTTDRAGSAFTEKMFLRSWTNDLYLWFAEVPDTNPNSIADIIQYFDTLKTTQTTPSGNPKDRFHFQLDTDEWIALSQDGRSIGYGAELMLIGDGLPPRRAVVAFVEPGTPAGNANVTRGMELLRINNVDFVNDNTQAGVDVLNDAFFPSAAGLTFTFRFQPPGGGAAVDIPLTSADITHTPVLVSRAVGQAGDMVGYIAFNDHIATAERELVEAINNLQGVNDLVLDLRYNGGGFLDIASELTYMISGRTGTFETLVFNSKNPNRNPVTNQPLTPTPIHTTTQDFSLPEGQPLPTLNLNRVYVITGPNTCSASESIMNGLRGVGVEVFQIGSTTCGKPFGFYAQDNCGTTYFSIQFQGLNALNFGDYPDGFAPQNQTGRSSVLLPGCSIADDFTRALGDTTEGRLKAALDFRASGNSNASCGAATGFAPGAQLKAGQPLSVSDGQMIKSPVRENRIIRD
jgi:carboxyl-terminal processing protease